MIGRLSRHCQRVGSRQDTVLDHLRNRVRKLSVTAFAAICLGPWSAVGDEPAAVDEPAAETPAAAPFAAGDRLVFIRDGDLWSAAPDGSAARPLASTPEREVRPVPCPDGSVIAYEAYDTEQQDYGIWIMAVNGGAPTRLIERARNPAWSPDGGRLAFSMRRRGSLDIWLMNRDGDDLMRVLDTPENEYLPAWSPSGGSLAFVREVREANRNRYELIVRAADGSESIVYTRLGQGLTSLCWAPSESLLFTSRRDDEPLDRLFRIVPGEAEPVAVTDGFDGGAAGVWTGTRGGIIYLARRNDQSRIAVLDGEQSTALSGLRESDTEPAVLPGPANRAAQLTILGRRSYYLPCPQIAGDDVLVPLPELAKQLSLTIKAQGQTVSVSSPTITIAFDVPAGSAVVTTLAGDETRPLLPAPRTVDGVLLVPLKTVATWLGLPVDWRPGERLLRVSRPAASSPPEDSPPPAG